MLDIRRIRSEPDAVKASLARRGIDTADVDRVAELDGRQRRLASERDELRAQIKGLSKQVGLLHKEGKADEAAAAQAESRRMGEQEQALATETAAIALEVRDLLLRIPNTPHPDSPDGFSGFNRTPWFELVSEEMANRQRCIAVTERFAQLRTEFGHITGSARDLADGVSCPSR